MCANIDHDSMNKYKSEKPQSESKTNHYYWNSVYFWGSEVEGVCNLVLCY